MDYSYEQLAARLRPEHRTPEIVEMYRPCLEYLCEISRIRRETLGVSPDSPEARELHHHHVRNGLPYEQEQG